MGKLKLAIFILTQIFSLKASCLLGRNLEGEKYKTSILFARKNFDDLGRVDPNDIPLSKFLENQVSVFEFDKNDSVTLRDDGFSLVTLDEKFKRSFESVRKIVNSMNDQNLSDQERSILKKTGPKAVAAFLKRLLSSQDPYNNKNIVCSKNFYTRVGSTNLMAKHVSKPFNIAHVDYPNPDFAYHWFCDGFSQLDLTANCSPKDKLEMVINLWIPTQDEPIRNWPLGFLKPNAFYFDMLDTYPKADQGWKLYYKKGMKWGEAYLFKSYDVVHASFEEEDYDPEYVRRSIDVRCLVFRK